jgi:hypothetical protein
MSSFDQHPPPDNEMPTEKKILSEVSIDRESPDEGIIKDWGDKEESALRRK